MLSPLAGPNLNMCLSGIQSNIRACLKWGYITWEFSIGDWTFISRYSLAYTGFRVWQKKSPVTIAQMAMPAWHLPQLRLQNKYTQCLRIIIGQQINRTYYLELKQKNIKHRVCMPEPATANHNNVVCECDELVQAPIIKVSFVCTVLIAPPVQTCLFYVQYVLNNCFPFFFSK